MAIARRPASRFRFLVVVLILISLTLVSLDASGKGDGALGGVRRVASDILSPVQGAVHDTLRPIGNFLTGAVDYGSLQRENTQLRRELAALRAEEASSGYEQLQAQQVLRDDHLPYAESIQHVTAAITNVGSSNFEQTITIDKGTAEGVEANEPVVSAGGLVGVVSTAESATATVELLTDPNLVVGVKLDRGNVGEASGQGLGYGLTVKVVNSGQPAPTIKKGSILFTSGLFGENYPTGIPVGQVVSVHTPEGETEPVASLKPLVDPTGLGYVDVLLWSTQTGAPTG